MFWVMAERGKEREAAGRCQGRWRKDPVAVAKQIRGAAWTMGMRRWSSFAICGGASKMRGVDNEERGGTAGRRNKR